MTERFRFRSAPALAALFSIVLIAAAGPGARAAEPIPDPAGPVGKDTRLLRLPDLHGDRIVFVYGGDLWTVSRQGGTARRLTTDAGAEMFPKFSPDGKWIAFSASYDGNQDVYVIAADGGEPRRLTWHPLPDGVLEWTPDGKSILFRSTRTSASFRYHKLFTVPVEGGSETELPLPEGGLSSFSPDGKKLAYNRIVNEFSTWKRYKGGMAQDVAIYDFERNTYEEITNWEGADNFPMWHGNTIYFCSDREHTLNLYAYDLGTKQTRKVTDHSDYDVKWPSLGNDGIVYENGGWLWVLDLPSGSPRRLSIDVWSDNVLTRPAMRNVSGLITGGDLSPAAKRVVFAARGDLFTVPAEKGEVRNLTRTPGIRERDPVWSPDGKWIAYLSDRTGEYEVFLLPQDGLGKETQVTTGGTVFRFSPRWSPDSKKLLFSDKTYTLFWLDVDSKKIARIDKSDHDDITEYAWSPDSKWVTYTKVEPNYFGSIFLYSLAGGKATRVTTDFTDDHDPVFDPEGKYLYFRSLRHFDPTFSSFENEFTFNDASQVYAVTLAADTESPVKPESDEEGEEEGKEGKDGKDGDGEKDAKDGDSGGKKEKEGEEEKVPDMKVDLAGIEGRVVQIPIDPGNFFGLEAGKKKLFYGVLPTGPDGDDDEENGGGGGGNAELRMFDLEEREEKVILAGISGFDLSKDQEKVLYVSGRTWGIVDAKPEQKMGDGKIATDDLKMLVDPRAEWKEMFDEAWRLERDFYYDPNMHGVDWNLMRTRYGQLVPYVAHRGDLSYLLGELIGELCTSHTYVGGGDSPGGNPVSVGLLGADFDPDAKAGYYRFRKIFRENDWNTEVRAPLAEPGIQVKEGDYLISVEGVPARTSANVYSYFQNLAGKQIRIRVNAAPREEGAREYVVRAIPSEARLRYVDWVTGNRRKVAEASNGKIGYIHVPDTAFDGLIEFSKAFYPQIRKEGLILDERYNSGGFIPDMFMARLRRSLVSLWSRREGESFQTPTQAVHGHLACISNAWAGSGGDLFPWMFQKYGLGPVIGTRTWGGLVGISRNLPLMDGGVVTVPDFGMYDPEGNWAVENHGTDPDIVVDNRPDLVIQGRDPQLEKTVEVLMEKIRTDPVKLPPVPKYPIKK